MQKLLGGPNPFLYHLSTLPLPYPLPFLPIPLSSIHFPSLPSEVGFLQLEGLRERCNN